MKLHTQYLNNGIGVLNWITVVKNKVVFENRRTNFKYYLFSIDENK